MDSRPSLLREQRKLQRLRCSVQCYDWGRRGQHSLVAGLFARNSGSEIQPDKSYAELWMGTHESGPSFVVQTSVDNAVSVGSEDVSLKSWVSENPEALGDKVLDKWGCDLPFLFKVQLCEFVCMQICVGCIALCFGEFPVGLLGLILLEFGIFI
jgi:mannose-6-phosphate isomerase class I